MIIRPFEKRDLVWLRPMAEKWGDFNECKAMADDPDKFGLLTALVVAPYTIGVIFYDTHGTVLEGLCDDYGIKQFIRLGDYMVKVADEAGIDLHNHKWGQKPWYSRVLTRLGFEKTIPEVGHIRIASSGQAKKEVA